MASYQPQSEQWLHARDDTEGLDGTDGPMPDQAGQPEPAPRERIRPPRPAPAGLGEQMLHAHHEYAPAGQVPDGAPDPRGHPAERDSEELWAMLSYLGVIFLGFLAPLAIYLAKRGTSRYVRHHAARSLNLSITGTLFNLSALIIGGMLALDTVAVALIIVVPLATALWLTTLVYLVRAAIAADRGEQAGIPGWLCVPMIK